MRHYLLYHRQPISLSAVVKGNSMQKTLHVHILKASQTNAIDLLKQKLDPNVAVSYGGIDEIPVDTSILVAGEPTIEMLAALPNLRSLIIPWAGVSPETFDVLRGFPHVSIHNLHHNALPVAEYALALLLSAANSIVPVDRCFACQRLAPQIHSYRFNIDIRQVNFDPGFWQYRESIIKFTGWFQYEYYGYAQ